MCLTLAALPGSRVNPFAAQLACRGEIKNAV